MTRKSKSTSIMASGLGGINDTKRQQDMVVTTLADLLREDQAQSLT